MIVSGNSHEVEQKMVSILKVLSESAEPVGSTTIARDLEHHGISLSERAVRYHLKIMDERGYTQPVGRDGRMLTPLGIEELKSALIPEQVGFMKDRLELLAFLTTFDPETKRGRVAINTTLFRKEVFREALSAMEPAFKAGLCVSNLVGVAAEGERLGDVVIPPGKVGLATVCSVTLNGVLLKAGIPMESRFGGVLELRNSRPKRFTSIIEYAGSSVDPSEAYIRARMTRVVDAARDGAGRILANFREIPAPARALTQAIIAKAEKAGISGALLIGEASEPICQIPVGLNRVGITLLGGLNPVAAAVESGIPVENVPESGTVDYQSLRSFWDL
ncbi:MAG: NrpR regulatory domain-containing protein [Dehalococcoidia bacterium]|nr:NrpR regulatory domain-containing protein [Dehalococcoidia bacterium]